MSVGGEAHLERAGLAVQGPSLAIDGHRDRDVARRRDGLGSDYRYRCHVLFVNLCRRRDRFDVVRMFDAKNRRPRARHR